MRFSFIPFLLLVIPMLEIGAFIIIGGQIGVFWTLAMIVVTAIIGSILLRVQGFGLLARIQGDMKDGKVPARELVHGVMILIAGVLLLTPGFVTDSFGFLLFVQPLRDLGWRFLKNRISIVQFSEAGHRERPSYDPQGSDGPTIDLTEDDFSREGDPDSPWSKDQPDERG